MRFPGCFILLVVAITCLSGVPAAASPLQGKVEYWLSLYSGAPRGTFEEAAAFLAAHPDWPAQKTLQKEVERMILPSTSAEGITRFFDRNPPLSAQGMSAYARALSASGRQADVKDKVNAWWPKADLSREEQRTLYQEYAALLSPDAQKKRLDYLLYEGKDGQALTIADVLGQGYPQLAAARLALMRQEAGAEAALSRVPETLKNDTGLMFERMRWRRRKDLDDGAISLLPHTPAFEEMHDPEAWWQERHILARRLMDKKQYKRAYGIILGHNQKEGLPFAQAQWLAGWLALRFNNDAKAAFKHFERLYNETETPLSKSRGAYWAGKSAQAAGQSDIARQWFDAAARYRTTFYGQIAAREAGITAPLALPSVPPLSGQAKAQFTGQELTQAAKTLHKAGMRAEAELFLIALRENNQNANGLRYVAELAQALGFEKHAINAAQDSFKFSGVVLPDLAYPIIPQAVQGIADVEWAMIHSLIRQESRFDSGAVSPAGAKGLMQVMPATARAVAKKAGFTHNESWLTQRPDHNIKIGSRFIRDMIRQYDGNYALALAAYNAGPGRVNSWLKQYGDPRSGEISMIDWIELIPFYETRNYVQRVLEGVYVYRERLKGIQKPPAAAIHVVLE